MPHPPSRELAATNSAKPEAPILRIVHELTAEVDGSIVDMISPADARAEAIRAYDQKIGQALIAFSRNYNLRIEIADVNYGGWYIIDADKYDGEPLALSETPVGALLAWHEREIERAAA